MSNNLNIPLEDFLMIVLNGDLFSSVAIPLSIGNLIKQIPEYDTKLHLDRPSELAQFYELYSIPGWENELRRREYLVSISIPAKPIPVSKPQVKDKFALSPELQAMMDKL